MGLRSTAALPFLESVPEVAAKLKEPNTKDESFDDVVKSAQDAAVLVLVYCTTKERRNQVLPAWLLCFLVVQKMNRRTVLVLVY
jgi:hypothetical protein